MNTGIIPGIIIPFIGTSLGAACVFFMKNELKKSVQRALTGFAAGVYRILAWNIVPAYA